MSATQRNDRLWEAEVAAPEANGVVLADWWRRVAALVIDTAILWIPVMLAFRSMERLPRMVVFTVVSIIYFVLLNGSRRGQTLGKMVWDIRVRDAATGGRLGPAKALRRHLIPAPFFMIPILGLALWLTNGLWPLWDRRRQAVHDKLAGSVVVSAH
ncbi:MAG: RDD family protein [Actinomycetota bacterium]|jgi:uncharacterized RDD family membrane protein YckC